MLFARSFNTKRINTKFCIQNFLAATAPSTFAILIERHEHNRADEFTFYNAATKEEFSVRNAHFIKPRYVNIIYYVEIMRHPKGADAKMRDWIEKRAFCDDDREKQILIGMSSWPSLTIG